MSCSFGNYSIQVNDIGCMFMKSNNPTLLFVGIIVVLIILTIFIMLILSNIEVNENEL